MPCEPVEFVNGATLANATILNSEITNSHLTAPTVSGGISADALTLEQLADDIAPFLPAPALDTSAVAAVFKDCTNGNPLTAGQQIVTCIEFAARLAEVKAEAEAAFELFKQTIENLVKAETILGQLKSCGDLPLTPGTNVPTCDEMTHAIDDATDPSKIAGVFKNREGNPLSPGTIILSKLETEELVDNAISLLSDSGIISSATWSGSVLTIVETKVDGTTASSSVDFNKFLSAVSTTSTPPTSTTTGTLPLKVYGSRDGLLGAPASFLPVIINGVSYVAPLYQL
jgi:hypothetical protein